MTDLFKLILGVLASLFKSRATLEAEILVLRQQINVLRRRAPKRSHLNNTDRFLFVWLYRWFPSALGAIAIIRPETINSLAPSWISGVLALAVAQPYWQTEGLG
jgi:hypothetical protein